MDIVNYIATGEEQVVRRPAASMKNESRVTSQGSDETNYSTEHVAQIVRKMLFLIHRRHYVYLLNQ